MGEQFGQTVLRGVKYRPVDAASLLWRNLLIYGISGIIAPFPGIWLIDQLPVALRAAQEESQCGNKFCQDCESRPS